MRGQNRKTFSPQRAQRTQSNPTQNPHVRDHCLDVAPGTEDTEESNPKPGSHRLTQINADRTRTTQTWMLPVFSHQRSSALIRS